MSDDPLWTNNIGILFDTDKLTEIIPSNSLPHNKKMNALARLVLLGIGAYAATQIGLGTTIIIIIGIISLIVLTESKNIVTLQPTSCPCKRIIPELEDYNRIEHPLAINKYGPDIIDKHNLLSKMRHCKNRGPNYIQTTYLDELGIYDDLYSEATSEDRYWDGRQY